MKKLMPELTKNEKETLLMMAAELTERELVEWVKQPKPEGLGVELGKTSVHRLLEQAREERVEEEAEETKQRAKRINALQGKDGGELEDGALAVLRQRFFQEASRTGRTMDVASMYRGMRELFMKEERIALARERAKISRESWNWPGSGSSSMRREQRWSLWVSCRRSRRRRG